MKCWNCGRSIKPNSHYCPYCGATQMQRTAIHHDKQESSHINLDLILNIAQLIWAWIINAVLEPIYFFFNFYNKYTKASKTKKIVYGLAQIGLFMVNAVTLSLIQTELLRHGFMPMFRYVKNAHIFAFVMLLIEDKLFRILKRGYGINFILITLETVVFYWYYHTEFHSWIMVWIGLAKIIGALIIFGFIIAAGTDDVSSGGAPSGAVGTYHSSSGDYPIYRDHNYQYYYDDGSERHDISNHDDNADIG